MQEIWDSKSASLNDVKFIVINAPGYESGIKDLAKPVDIAILQDDNTTKATSNYGAGRSYIYLIDKAGHPRYIHYSLDIEETEKDRLMAEIAELQKADS